MEVTGAGECRSVQQELGIYAVGAAPPESVEPIEWHLARCGPCVAVADWLTEAAIGLALLSEGQARRLVDEVDPVDPAL